MNHAAAIEQQNLLITTLITAAIACLCIGLFGWFISRTLVQRLNLLRRVTQAVEKGQLDSRVTIMGQDEIADVSASVNTMLDTIVGLLQETQSQRDAMTNAANRLFSYMQVVSAGELRASTVTSDDPIGMLADAFNFTVGRFRRFALRTQTNVEQLEVILRQEMEHSESFMQSLQVHIPRYPLPIFAATATQTRINTDNMVKDGATAALMLQMKRAHQYLLQGVRALVQTYIRTMLTQIEQASTIVVRLRRTPSASLQTGHTNTNMRQEQDLYALELLLQELGTVIQAMQLNASRDLSEVEKILQQSLATLQTSDLEAGLPPESAVQTELAQLTVKFVQDRAALTRQVGGIVQEIRNNVGSFKIDVVDGPAIFSPAPTPSGGPRM